MAARGGPGLSHPARLVAAAFAGLITLGTLALLLPPAWAGPGGAPFAAALFTATSAVTVTGLSVVDTGTAWTGFGQALIALLAQVGGLGILTLASVVSLLVADRLGLRARVRTQAEAGSIDPGDLRRTIKGVAVFSFAFEAALALILTLRLLTAYDESFGRALWLGVFHSVMAFNNAGFGLHPDNLVRYVSDWWINLPVMGVIVAGGVGFPVLDEISRRWRPKRWSLHTRLTLTVTAALLVAGAVATCLFEWTNPATLGALSAPDSVLAGAFHSVTSRTAGFNTIDTAAMEGSTWLVTILLMFIGSGSASTGGGIKVTTFAVLVLICWSEARGDADVTYRGRTIPTHLQRQALVVTLTALVTVMLGTFLVLLDVPERLEPVLFDSVSAFATVGLSSGITGTTGLLGEVTLVVLMFLGRIGPMTLGLALVLRQRERRYRYPEGRPLVG